MKKLHPPLQHLQRPEVTQILLSTGRPPRAVVGDGFETLGTPVTSETILSLLFATGGSRYLDDLGPRPTTWKMRLDGIGTVSVSAAQHGDDLEAQFTPPARAYEAPSPPPSPSPSPPPQPPQRAARTNPDRVVTKPIRKSSGNLRAGRSPSAERPLAKSILASSDAPPPSKRRRASGPPADPAPAFQADLNVDETPRSPAAVVSIPPDVDIPIEIEIVTPRRSEAPVSKRSTGKQRQAARLSELCALARQEGASDLHLIAGRPPLLRVAGELTPQGDDLTPAEVEAMAEACVPARVAPALRELGSCDFALELRDHGRFRVNVARQRSGFKIALRLIALEIPTLASLGIVPELGAVTHQHQGLVVLTGPTGHGKTSTLAALVDLLNRESTRHIITVEDPVEYMHPRRRALISQREVGTHTRSFAAALKGSLREDPDVIVVGELRDTETVRMALAASETGHLVMGTMNTPSASKTIDRLIDLFPPADQQQVRTTLAGGLKMIASQRLVPRADKSGMAVAVELLPGSLALWNLIRDNKTFQLPSLMQRGKGVGVIRLNDSLADLVRANKVTRDAALVLSDAPEELDVLLHRREAGPPSIPPPQPPRPSKPPPPPEPRGLMQRAGALFKKGG